MSNKKLSGSIPNELGSLVYLQILLDLRSNSLSHAIPSNLEKLKNLQKLNLSHSELNGSIPAGFSHVSSLEKVDFSYNQLTGEIPSWSAFQNTWVNAYIGNLGLYGNVQSITLCRVQMVRVGLLAH